MNIKKIKKQWKLMKNKPITWGAYSRLCKWTFGITGLIYLGIFVWWKIQDWRDSRKVRVIEE